MAMAGATGFRINSFVFFGLETSHLYPTDRPTITEMSLVAINRKGLLHPDVVSSLHSAGIEGDMYDLSKVSLPRIMDKLTLCLDPRKYISSKASSLTKLDKQNLDENKKLPFNEVVVLMLTTFLSRQEAPVCLVAHNGNRFDFPILRSELSRLSSVSEDPLQDVYCVDTLIGFRAAFTTTNKEVKKVSACVPPEPVRPLNRVRSDYDDTSGMSYLQTHCPTFLPNFSDVDHYKNFSLSPGVTVPPVQGWTESSIRPRGLPIDLGIDRYRRFPLQEREQPDFQNQLYVASHTPSAVVPFVQSFPDNMTPQLNFQNYSTPPTPPLKKVQSEPRYCRSNRGNHGNTKPKRISYSQVNIFKKTFGREPPNSHFAEDDAVSLIKILLPKMPEFVSWSDIKATPFKNCKLYYIPE